MVNARFHLALPVTDLQAAAEFYGEVANALEVPLESEVVGDILLDNRLKSDAVHPNAAGYQKMAEAVADLLHDAGAL